MRGFLPSGGGFGSDSQGNGSPGRHSITCRSTGFADCGVKFGTDWGLNNSAIHQNFRVRSWSLRGSLMAPSCTAAPESGVHGRLVAGIHSCVRPGTGLGFGDRSGAGRRVDGDNCGSGESAAPGRRFRRLRCKRRVRIGSAIGEGAAGLGVVGLLLVLSITTTEMLSFPPAALARSIRCRDTEFGSSTVAAAVVMAFSGTSLKSPSVQISRRSPVRQSRVVRLAVRSGAMPRAWVSRSRWGCVWVCLALSSPVAPNPPPRCGLGSVARGAGRGVGRAVSLRC